MLDEYTALIKDEKTAAALGVVLKNPHACSGKKKKKKAAELQLVALTHSYFDDLSSVTHTYAHTLSPTL